jgi:GntR family transcriptional regulator / MocR family aminotransferase
MVSPDPPLSLDTTAGIPLGRRVTLTLQRAILEGRFVPGQALPGSRVLAGWFGVNRLTIVAALRELEAQGWILTRNHRTTCVAEAPPVPARTEAPTATPPSDNLGFDLPSARSSLSTESTSRLHLADGAADPRLAPSDELSRAYYRAIQRHGPSLLQDRDPLGTPFLRESLAEWISERQGVRIDPARILLTRGSRISLGLVAAALFRPGEVAAVENPGNRSAWDVLRLRAEMALRPVPLDEEGMVPGALEELLAREPVRLLYLTPRRQVPTGSAMSRARADAILALAHRHRIAVLEDDYDGEFSYEEPRPLTLLAQDPHGQVIHLGSLSRLLGPGIRMGFLVLPEALAVRLARMARTLEDQGDPAFEWAVADLMRDGELARHLRRVRRIYRARRDLLAGLLGESLGDALRVHVPAGGMGLWLQAAPAVDVPAWLEAAGGLGLILHRPAHFFLGKPEPAFRMGFAQAEEAELARAVDVLVKTRPGA